MDFNFTTNAKQDAVIQWKTNLYNASLPEGSTPLTPKQWAMQELQLKMAQWSTEFLTDRLQKLNQKFVEADDTKRQTIEQAAQ